MKPGWVAMSEKAASQRRTLPREVLDYYCIFKKLTTDSEDGIPLCRYTKNSEMNTPRLYVIYVVAQ